MAQCAKTATARRCLTCAQVLWAVLLGFGAAHPASAQSAGDYRTATSGQWDQAGTWETYNGSAWVAASVSPDSSDGVLTIRNGHTVTIDATTNQG